MSNLQKKIPFMAGVFGHLIFQTFVAYRAAEATSGNAYMKDIARSNALLIGIVGLALVLLLSLVRLPIPVKVAVFSLLAYISGMALHNVPNLQEALLEVVGIFIGMLVAGIFTVQMGYKLDILGQILFFSLLTILIARVINIYVRRTRVEEQNSLVPSRILTILFALFVVYDTNKILQRNYSGNFVNASLDYFLDIFNLIRSVGGNE
jgi:FtsH-binding integral membrane protein|tara:strand:+ start:343 stop:963 length:621 start_codon:yes stop_codon:yes gene_type:complete